MKDQETFRRLLSEANEAKERLARIAEKLEEAGYKRKASSCMKLVYQIETWQNRGRKVNQHGIDQPRPDGACDR